MNFIKVILLDKSESLINPNNITYMLKNKDSILIGLCNAKTIWIHTEYTAGKANFINLKVGAEEFDRLKGALS